MPFSRMARNIANAGFEPTPDSIASQIMHLLSFPHEGSVVALDPTFGLGALVKPLTHLKNVSLLGAEIAGDRAHMGQKAVPQARVYHTDVLHMDVSPGSISLLLSNPPYLQQDGRRLEYHIYRHIFQKKWMIADGVIVAILAMRQWKAHLSNLWGKYCYDCTAYKFPDHEFSKYTQGLIIARVREFPLDVPDPDMVRRMQGWYYDSQRANAGIQPWRQGYSLPEIPAQAGIVTYPVPTIAFPPQVILRKASSDMIWEALQKSGIQTSEEWGAATTYDPTHSPFRPPLMPLIGKAHLAALILSGLLDGRVLLGPDGKHYIFASFITTKWEESPIDGEELLRHVVRKRQLQDLPILGVLDCERGETHYYHGAQAYTFLDPWFASLARLVLQEHQPRYDLSNWAPWMLDVVATIGNDKHLPGSPFPGLAIPQIHRVFAHWQALSTLGKDAFQGEPGTGKTRMVIALMALMAHYWQHRDDPSFLAQGTTRRPPWVKGVKNAWKNNPWTTGDFPKALPLAVVTPKRVIKSAWEGEIRRAWPEAQTIIIENHTDIMRWMRLCADGYCFEANAQDKREKRPFPAVIALFSQSTTRPSRLKWHPAVIPISRGTQQVPDLQAEGEPVYDGFDKLIGKRDHQGVLITKTIHKVHFLCPDCLHIIKATPRSLQTSSTPADAEEEMLEKAESEEQRPVESIEWFQQQPRFCTNLRPLKERRGRAKRQTCGAALWSMHRIEAIERKAPQLPFSLWTQGIAARTSKGILSPPSSETETSAQHCRILTHTGSLGPALPDSFSPYDYYAHFYKGCCAFTSIDESHNAQAQNSNIARAIHHILQASQTRMLASGTHYPGTLERFFYYWFRFEPSFWLNLGITWKMVHHAIREYGVLMQITEEHTTTKKGVAEIELSTTTKAAPGVSSRLLPLLLAFMCYIDVLDVGAHMPSRKQIPIIIPMRDNALEEQITLVQKRHAEATKSHLQAQALLNQLAIEHAEATKSHLQAQALLNQRGRDSLKNPQELQRASEEVEITAHLVQEIRQQLQHASEEVETAAQLVQEVSQQLQHLMRANLANGYDTVVDSLTDQAKRGNSTARMMLGMLPRWWVSYPFEPAFTLVKNEKGDWGEHLQSHIIFTAPTLRENYEYPLERAVREQVQAECAEMIEGSTPPRSRRIMLYYEQTTRRDVGARYAHILKEYNPWVLPEGVKPEDREDAIWAAVERGHSVLLVPYRKVSEGLNLQLLDTIMWIEMPMNLIQFDQSGRRLWRLGKKEEVREYIFAYQGTVAHEKMERLASESGAASLFMGNSPVGALATLVGADQGALAQVARKLDTVQDLVAAFSARDQERAQVLAQGREWLGIHHDPLPASYQQMRIEKQPQSIEERVPSSLPPKRRTSNLTWLDLALQVEQQREKARQRPPQQSATRPRTRSKAVVPETEIVSIPALFEENALPVSTLVIDLWGEIRSIVPTSKARRKGKHPRTR